ncbi:hypothetical protein [Marinobacter sp. CA1]|uniref:hypothetical protein n=1 Tax=Marinobacter sp. CA1 TaxID=2817656 RepID=UPI001D093B42|nr:hypothetical protein [Marinobacter sp. CA1]UDL06114.1 hypothetical protein J2887_04970 [Marinobacter sp. CA1]
MERLTQILILLCIVALAGCEKNNVMTESTTKSEPVVNHSIGNLDHLIALPAEPESVKWSRTNTADRGGDSGLVAVFRFSQEDYESILKRSDGHEVVGDAIVNQSFYDKWVPEEVKENLAGELHADGESIVLVGRPSLKPNLFVNKETSSPYIHGNVYPLGMGYIALGLYTM